MKLNDSVALSIFNYPSLYARNTFVDSRHQVLGQYFLVIGGGITYINPTGEKYVGWFGDDHDDRKIKTLTDEVKQRLIAGEKICRIYRHIHQDYFKKYGFISPSFNYEHEKQERTALLSDFLKEGVKYLNVDYNLNQDGLKIEKPNPTNYEYFIEIYPDANDEYIQYLREMEQNSNRKSNYDWHPYPFSIKFTPMWDRTNDCFIPKDMIMPDWIEGMIEIYQKTLNWLEDDNCFNADNYYNWAELDNLEYFQKAWDKQPDKLAFCKEYEIEPVAYTDVREMARAIVRHQHVKRIDDCKQILAFYKG